MSWNSCHSNGSVALQIRVFVLLLQLVEGKERVDLFQARLIGTIVLHYLVDPLLHTLGCSIRIIRTLIIFIFQLGDGFSDLLSVKVNLVHGLSTFLRFAWIYKHFLHVY